MTPYEQLEKEVAEIVALAEKQRIDEAHQRNRYINYGFSQ